MQQCMEDNATAGNMQVSFVTKYTQMPRKARRMRGLFMAYGDPSPLTLTLTFSCILTGLGLGLGWGLGWQRVSRDNITGTGARTVVVEDDSARNFP